jgi:hypothetical protein
LAYCFISSICLSEKPVVPITKGFLSSDIIRISSTVASGAEKSITPSTSERASLFMADMMQSHRGLLTSSLAFLLIK